MFLQGRHTDENTHEKCSTLHIIREMWVTTIIGRLLSHQFEWPVSIRSEAASVGKGGRKSTLTHCWRGCRLVYFYGKCYGTCLQNTTKNINIGRPRGGELSSDWTLLHEVLGLICLVCTGDVLGSSPHPSLVLNKSLKKGLSNTALSYVSEENSIAKIYAYFCL